MKGWVEGMKGWSDKWMVWCDEGMDRWDAMMGWIDRWMNAMNAMKGWVEAMKGWSDKWMVWCDEGMDRWDAMMWWVNVYKILWRDGWIKSWDAMMGWWMKECIVIDNAAPACSRIHCQNVLCADYLFADPSLSLLSSLTTTTCLHPSMYLLYDDTP